MFEEQSFVRLHFDLSGRIRLLLPTFPNLVGFFPDQDEALGFHILVEVRFGSLAGIDLHPLLEGLLSPIGATVIGQNRWRNTSELWFRDFQVITKRENEWGWVDVWVW